MCLMNKWTVCLLRSPFNDKGHAATTTTTTTTTMSATWKLWDGTIWRIRVTKYNLFNGDDEHSTVQLSLKCDPFYGQIAQRHTWLTFQNTDYVWCCVRRRCIQLWIVSISWYRIQHFTTIHQRNGNSMNADCLFSIRSFRLYVLPFFSGWVHRSCDVECTWIIVISFVCIFSISCRLNCECSQKRTYINKTIKYGCPQWSEMWNFPLNILSELIRHELRYSSRSSMYLF